MRHNRYRRALGEDTQIPLLSTTTKGGKKRKWIKSNKKCKNIWMHQRQWNCLTATATAFASSSASKSESESQGTDVPIMIFINFLASERRVICDRLRHRWSKTRKKSSLTLSSHKKGRKQFGQKGQAVVHTCILAIRYTKTVTFKFYYNLWNKGYLII